MNLGDISDSLSGAADWLYDQAKKGPPGSPGRSTEAERTAYETGVKSLVVETEAELYKGYNFVVDELKAGPPGSMGRSTPAERDAYEQGVRNLPAKAKEAVSRAGAILEFMTRPAVLLVVGGVIVLAVAAPYVTPFIRSGR